MLGKKYFIYVEALFYMSFIICIALSASLVSLKRAEAAYAPDLFISEYIEGTSNNKALEIYNGTDGAVDLFGSDFTYKIQIYYNGGALPDYSLDLSGVIESNHTFVICHLGASQVLKDKANLLSLNLNFDGNDVVVLKKVSKKDSSEEILDVIGKIGERHPWGESFATQDHTLVKKSSIGQGDTNPLDFFDPSLEWDVYSVDTFVYLGSHSWSDYGIDSTPPAEVSDLRVTPGDGCLKLDWNEPNDPDFAKIVIYYKEVDAGIYSISEEVYKGTTSCTISNLISGKTYAIKVVTVDNVGNQSSGIGASGAPRDTVPPKVASQTPADNAVDVAVNAEISVTFDENVAEGARFNDIDIKDTAGNVVANVYGSLNGRKLIIAHNNFACDTTYTVVIPDGAVIDEVYNENLAISWGFTTVLPSVSGTISLVGPTDVAQGSEFTVKVKLEHLNAFYGAQVKLRYDSVKVQVLDADKDKIGVQVAAGDVFTGISPAFKQEIMNCVEVGSGLGEVTYVAGVTEQVYGVSREGPCSFVEVNFRALGKAGPVIITLDTEFTRIAGNPDTISFKVVPHWGQAVLSIRVASVSSKPGENEGSVSSKDQDSKRKSSNEVQLAVNQKVVHNEEEITIVLADGSIVVTFPAGALPVGTFVMISSIGADRLGRVPPGSRQEFFRIEAVNSDGFEMSFSRASFKIVSRLSGLCSSDPEPGFFYFDPVYNTWMPVFERDKGQENIPSITVVRFGIYAFMKREPRYFLDVPPVAWYEASVRKLAGMNLIDGFLGGWFKPHEFLTRGQAAKLVAFFAQVPGGSEGVGFYDTRGHWAENFINSLAKAGVVEGYQDRSFRPDLFITRAEFVTLVVKSLAVRARTQGKLLFSPGVSTIFCDLGESHWAAPFIFQAFAQGLVRGYPNGTFCPEENITRAEAAVVIYNALKSTNFIN